MPWSLHDRVRRSGTVWLPSGDYIISEPLVVPEGTRVVGRGAANTRILLDMPDAIKRAGVELVGMTRGGLEALTIQAARPLGCCVLLGRTAFEEQAGCNSFRDVHVTGYAVVAAVVSIASELDAWRDCSLATSQAGGAAYLTSSCNLHAIERASGPLWGNQDPSEGPQSNVGTLFSNCRFGVYAYTGKECCVIIEPISTSQRFENCYWSAKSRHLDQFGARAGLLLGSAAASRSRVDLVSLSGCMFEAYGAEAAIEVAVPVGNLSIHDTSLVVTNGESLLLRADVQSLNTSNVLCRNRRWHAEGAEGSRVRGVKGPRDQGTEADAARRALDLLAPGPLLPN